MSIVDSKVVISVDAETESARRNMELLRAQQQHFAAEVVKGLESQNKKLEDSISKWAKIGVGIGAAVGAIKLAKVGLEEYGRAQELLDATRGVRVDGLRAAARGLKTDMELLEFAAKTNAGAFKLTNDQMQLAVKAMEVYEDRGHDAAKVTDVLTDALIKGDTKGLRSFGVQIYETGTKAEKFQAVIKALKKDVAEAGEQTDVGTDSWKRHGVTIENAMSRMKQSLGEIVIALTPVVELLADAAKWLTDEYRPGGFKSFDEYNAFARQSPSQRAQAGVASTAAGVVAIQAQTKINTTQDALDTIIQAVALEAESRSEKAAKKGGGGGTTVRRDAMLGDQEQIEALLAYNAAGAPRVTGGMGGSDSSMFGGALDGLRGRPGDVDKRYAAWAARNTTSKMAEMFGPIEEFDVYTQAWTTLNGAVTTALDAWITGQVGVGKAVKMMLAETARGLAIEMSIKALRETAEAIAMLANPYTAALAPGHFKAAAAYTAGAAAAAVGARLLGAGGATSTGGSASAAPTLGAGVSSGAQQPRAPVIIAYGDDFADDSPRKRAQQARRLVSRGLAESSAGGAY